MQEVWDGSNTTNPGMLKVKLPYKPECHKYKQHHEAVDVKCNLHYELKDHAHNNTNPEIADAGKNAKKL